MYLELMVRTMERLTMKTMGMIKIPSNIVASTGKSKVQLIVEAKAHKDVLDLWNIINITITTITITITTLTAPTREENLCFLNHHRVPLIVASWHPGWEEMENLRGNG